MIGCGVYSVSTTEYKVPHYSEGEFRIPSYEIDNVFRLSYEGYNGTFTKVEIASAMLTYPSVRFTDDGCPLNGAMINGTYTYDSNEICISDIYACPHWTLSHEITHMLAWQAWRLKDNDHSINFLWDRPHMSFIEQMYCGGEGD